VPLKALREEDDERLADEPDRFWNVLVVGAAPGRLPPPVPVEGRAKLPLEPAPPTLPVEGRAPTLPVEGRVPTFPVEGRAPTLPVEGRVLAVPPPPWPEPQPRASRVLAEAPPPFARMRFWSGCHFCAGC